MTKEPLNLDEIQARLDALPEGELMFSNCACGIFSLWNLKTREHIAHAVDHGEVGALGHVPPELELFLHSAKDITALVAALRELEEEDCRWDKHSLVQIVDERDRLRVRVAELEIEVGYCYLNEADSEDDLYRLGVIPHEDYAKLVDARKGNEWARLTNLAKED